jgi:CHAT domain-containing protein
VSAQHWRDYRTRPPLARNAAALGEYMWERLLSAEMQKFLHDHRARRLYVVTDEEASALPWELLAKPRQVPFAVAGGVVRHVRLVGEARPLSGRAAVDGRLRVLVVADPQNNLEEAREEGKTLAALLAEGAEVEVRLRSGRFTTEQLRRELTCGNYDILHYAGHAFFHPRGEHSGLQLADGPFTARHLQEITSTGDGANASGARPALPRLIVLGACTSLRLEGAGAAARPAGEASTGPSLVVQPHQQLAASLLRAGVRALVGTFFEVKDSAAREFARQLYPWFVKGESIGTAVRNARRALRDVGWADWGNFLLYGDDALTL